MSLLFPILNLSVTTSAGKGSPCFKLFSISNWDWWCRLLEMPSMLVFMRSRWSCEVSLSLSQGLNVSCATWLLKKQLAPRRCEDFWWPLYAYCGCEAIFGSLCPLFWSFINCIMYTFVAWDTLVYCILIMYLLVILLNIIITFMCNCLQIGVDVSFPLRCWENYELLLWLELFRLCSFQGYPKLAR